ncbi:DUF5686 and carboxypeptidase-like regulatory domain-containing protein [Pontibacter mangrovi]|uniref:Carboxypeptidase-like regulatory domain-containing protein n=1 Tax=Pontibacter mangrovi TaxID=2589816 RepID=A0A501W748_9BACT|nr:DUF5686 and carboxypeptidase-like regulatory domain-containing protein [Pontibacter mangrovi]TPE45389.1 carboxypeptidase-like regulatory domain-containing protein [Pontibacter mangrovi]
MPYFRHLLLLYFCLLTGTVLAQVRQVQGVVRDAATGERLPFVSIVVNEGETGTTTNLEGEYRLRHRQPIRSLRFSYVGYQPSIVYPDSVESINVQLQPTAARLQEVVVLGTGENPAHRIIRLATQNRERHRLQNLESYTYRTYNKFILSATDVGEQELRDTLQLSKRDSAYLKMRKLLGQQHLFLLESVTDYAFLQPNHTKETILATRVSGLQQPSFGVVAAEAREFSVYDDLPVFFGKRYLSPISPSSTRKYNFVLQETVVQGQDSIFVISFEPEQGKNFEGLKGLLYINSSGWAVQNVLAGSAGDDKRNIQLQQRYERVGAQQQWFPTELDVELTIPQLNLNGHQPYAHMRTYITNINLTPSLRRSDFGVVALQQQPNANRRPDSFFQVYRPDSLTQLEQLTYERLDSVGRAQKLDRTIRTLEYLMSKQVPIGPISLDLKRLFRVSAFEGLRLGMGAHTNDLFSERYKVGGYWGYGFKDEEAKYGADASVILYQPLELQLKAVYFEDVLETGGRRQAFEESHGLLGSLRRALLTDMDYTTHQSIALQGRVLRYLQANAQLRQEERRPTLLQPTLLQPEGQPLPAFNLAEAVLSLRYAPGEQYMQQFNRLVPMTDEDRPVLWLQYTRGLDGVLDGDYGYNKYDLRLKALLRHRTFGESSFILAGGLVEGNAPLVTRYNGYGSNNPDYKLYTGEGFETMYPYEFFSDRYAALFFSQNFGKRLLNTRFFAPDLVAVTNVGVGGMEEPLQEQYAVAFRSMRKGFFESGLMLNNIISSPFSGVGVGAFYRYGPYSLANKGDNLRIKLTASLLF